MYYSNFILEIAFSKKRTQNRINLCYILTKANQCCKMKQKMQYKNDYSALHFFINYSAVFLSIRFFNGTNNSTLIMYNIE